MAGFLQAKQRVGGYEIDELVGKGGMGEVYRARQLSMDRVVALKVLAARLAKQDTTFAKRFVDEARAAGRLNHPNIIAVHDVGKAMIPSAASGGEEEAYYFSMEFVDGETIKQIVSREGPSRLQLVEKVMSAMADALVYAESMGVVHRDIKPDNIMVTSDGLVKLADLGLAQQMGDESVGEKDAQGRSRVMGTPMYMSPEQARGMATDHRSDQYSLGATLFHMLTGRAPFLGDTSKAIMRMHVFDPVPDPKEHAEVPEAWRKLCMRLMAKDPAQRYESAEKMRAAVRAAIEMGQAGVSRRIRPSGKPVKYDTRPTTERVASTSGFIPGWAKAAMAVAVLAAAAITIVILSHDGSRGDPPATATSQPAAPAGDDAVARARAAIGALPSDDEPAIEKLDALLGDTTNGAAREVLERARDERAKRVDERKAARESQQQRLAQAQQALSDGHLGAARDALAALAAEKPSFVADGVAAAQAKLDAAVQAKVDALGNAAGGAANDADLTAVQAQADAAGLAGDPAAAVAGAIAKRRAALTKAATPATPAKPKVDAKALWREAYGEVAKLRGAVPARYDQFPALAQRLAAKADADPALAEQLKRLGELGDLLDKADNYLRNQLRSAKPRINIRFGDHAQNLKVEDVDAENVYITTSSGRQPRSRALALGLDDELRSNLLNLPADKRAEGKRYVAAFTWYWMPEKTAEALAALPGDDPLAKTLATLEQSGRVLEVAAPVQRQGDGSIAVNYDFTKKDAALLADFAGEGASYGEHGLLWRSGKPSSAPVENDLPTLRWKGRLQPPLTISAKLIAGGDGECALIGALSGDKGVRVGIQHPQTFTIDVDPVLVSDGKLGIDHDNVARLNMLTALTIGIEVHADRKAVLSANGRPLGRGEAVPVAGDGPLTVALQAFQTQGKQVTLELLSLSISGRPSD